MRETDTLMRRRRALVLIAGVAGIAWSGGVCACAVAADPVIALTAGGELLTFDPGNPAAVPLAAAPSGLAAGDRLLAIGATAGQIVAVGTSGRLYVVDLNSDALVASGIPFTAAELSGAVGFAYGDLSGAEVVHADGSLCGELTLVGACQAAPSDAASGRAPNVLGAARAPITGPPARPGSASTPLFVIDGASGTLAILAQPPFGPGLQMVGSLGIPLSGPAVAFAVSRDGARGFLLAGEPLQTAYSVNLATGTATAIGPLASASEIRSMATIPPAIITQSDPVTGVYPVTGDHGPVVGLPDPAVEGRDKAVTVPVNRAGDPTQAASVEYSAGAAGDAAAGVDYLPVSGTIRFGPGQQYGSFTVPVLAGPARPVAPGYTGFSVGLGPATGAIEPLLPGASGWVRIIQTGHNPTSIQAPLTPAPILLAGVASTQTIAVVLAHGLGVQVTCPVPCTAKLTASLTTTATATGKASAATTTKLASKTLRLAKPGTYPVHLRLTAPSRHALRRARRATIVVIGRARFATGIGISARRSVTLVRRRTG